MIIVQLADGVEIYVIKNGKIQGPAKISNGTKGDKGDKGQDGKDALPTLFGTTEPTDGLGEIGQEYIQHSPKKNRLVIYVKGSDGKWTIRAEMECSKEDTHTPTVIDPLAEKRAACDKSRMDLRNRLIDNKYIEQLRMLDRVVPSLDEPARAQLNADKDVMLSTRSTPAQKDTARASTAGIYKAGMESAAMKTLFGDKGMLFGDVRFTNSKQSAQVYMGFAPEYAVLAGVNREIGSDSYIYAFKANWRPLTGAYGLSVHKFTPKPGQSLNTAAGAPRQDLDATTKFAGNIFEYIDAAYVTAECKGVTGMSQAQQAAFSSVEVGAYK